MAYELVIFVSILNKWITNLSLVAVHGRFGIKAELGDSTCRKAQRSQLVRILLWLSVNRSVGVKVTRLFR